MEKNLKLENKKNDTSSKWVVQNTYSSDPNAPYFEDLFVEFLNKFAQNTDVKINA